MKKITLLLACLLAVWSLITPTAALARGKKSKTDGYSSETSKTIHVKGYTRKDGTVVKGYDRALPGEKSAVTSKEAQPAKVIAPSGTPAPAAATVPLSAPKKTRTTKAKNVKRDKNGKIARNGKAKDDFKKQHPCPATSKIAGACPGYVIDHIMPLKRGGLDDASNMQWQTIEEGKAKDKTE